MAQNDSHSNHSRYTTSISHPRLHRIDAEAIRAFLPKYDAYCTEISERARQLLGTETASTEAVAASSLKFCVDRDQLESFIELGFIEGVNDYDNLSNDKLRLYLESKILEDATNLNKIDIN